MNAELQLFVAGLSCFTGPCACSCLPAAASLALSAQGSGRAVLAALSFACGRGSVHMLLAMLVFSLGRPVLEHLLPWRFQLSLTAGAALAVCGAFALTGKKRCAPCSSVRARPPFVLGLLTGLSPCVPVAAAWMYLASTAQGYARALSLSAAFGLGESIAPLALGAFCGGICGLSPARLQTLFPVIGGAMLFASGLYIILASPK